MTIIDIGTHAYVGTLKCGCGVSIVRDMPGFERETARDVAGMIRRGQHVERLPHKLACETFDTRCANYPHEACQRRLEAGPPARQLNLIPYEKS